MLAPMSLIFFLLILLETIYCRKTYIVQTEDEKIHFIEEHIETFKLPFENSLENYKKDSLVLHGTKELPITNRLDLQDHSLSRINRLDSISINSEGFVEFYEHRIPIKDLLHSPFVEEGIYISATQENLPTAINNTIVILSSTKVYLLDFYNYNSKILKKKQILYLYHVYENIQRREKSVFLNGKWWEFESKILAVFIVKEKDGFNFMLKVSNSSELTNYIYQTPIQKKSKKLVFLLIIGTIIAMFRLRRHLKYSKTILKGKLFLGKFVKKDCLIYKTSIESLSEHKRTFERIKHPCSIHIYYESEWIFNPLIVTEKTYQFNPKPVKYYSNTQLFNSDLNIQKQKFKKNIRKIISYFEYLHSIGIVHSGICPENIRITPQENIRIQNIFENNGWKSRNQLKNIKKRNYNPNLADDIFSLGCLIHYYLTGYHPFDLRDFNKYERKTAKKNANTLAFFNLSSSHQALDAVRQLDNENSNKEIDQADKTVFLDDRKSIFSTIKNIFKTIVLYIEAWKIKIFNYFRVFKKFNIFSYFKVENEKSSQNEETANIYIKVIADDKTNYIENNILYGTYKIRLNDQIEHDFVYHAIDTSAEQNIIKLSSHPYLWDSDKCLEFISDISDFIGTNIKFKPRLERNKKLIFQGDWSDYIDKNIWTLMTYKRKYDSKNLCDLIRFIRNLNRHFQEININGSLDVLERHMFDYFSNCFPELLMFLYRSQSFQDYSVFQKYYE